jgi:hypothetical protein
MLKSKKISIILILIALSGCASEKIANDYLPTVFNASKFTYGGWIVVELKEKKDQIPGNTISGELITLQGHQLFILDTRQMNVITDSSVHKARLYIYKKQTGVFVVLTIIGFLPNVIAAIAFPENAIYFLAIGLVPLVLGTIFISTEAGNKRNQLIFPKKNSLDEFIKFSRFPQGIPQGLDIYQLKLPEPKNNKNQGGN